MIDFTAGLVQRCGLCVSGFDGGRLNHGIH